MDYAIKNKGGNYFVTNDVEPNIQDLINIGYKQVHEGIIPDEYDEYTMELTKDIVEREDGEYEYKYTAVVSKAKIEKSISILKQQLADTDYKVVKNMEYQMAMMTSVEPNTIILDLYDPKELHNERQALRDKINELENLLKTN